MQDGTRNAKHPHCRKHPPAHQKLKVPAEESRRTGLCGHSVLRCRATLGPRVWVLCSFLGYPEDGVTLLAGVVLILVAGGVSGTGWPVYLRRSSLSNLFTDRKPDGDLAVQFSFLLSAELPARGAGEFAGDVWWIFICLGLTVASWLWASRLEAERTQMLPRLQSPLHNP